MTSYKSNIVNSDCKKSLITPANTDTSGSTGLLFQDSLNNMTIIGSTGILVEDSNENTSNMLSTGIFVQDQYGNNVSIETLGLSITDNLGYNISTLLNTGLYIKDKVENMNNVLPDGISLVNYLGNTLNIGATGIFNQDNLLNNVLIAPNLIELQHEGSTSVVNLTGDTMGNLLVNGNQLLQVNNTGYPSALIGATPILGTSQQYMTVDSAPALESTGVQPGSYMNCGIEVDIKGRVTQILPNLEMNVIYLSNEDFRYGPYISGLDNTKYVFTEDINFGKGWNTPSQYWKFYPNLPNLSLFSLPTRDLDDPNQVDPVPTTYLQMPQTGWNSMCYIWGNNIEIDLNGHVLTIALDMVPMFAFMSMNAITLSNSAFGNICFPPNYEENNMPQFNNLIQESFILRDPNNFLRTLNDINNPLVVTNATNVSIYGNGTINATNAAIYCNNSMNIKISNLKLCGWTTGISADYVNNITIENIVITGLNNISSINQTQGLYYLYLLQMMFYYKFNNLQTDVTTITDIFGITTDKTIVQNNAKQLIYQLFYLVIQDTYKFFDEYFKVNTWLTNIRSNTWYAIKIGRTDLNTKLTTFPLSNNVSSENVEFYVVNNYTNYLSNNVTINNVTIENIAIGQNAILNNKYNIISQNNNIELGQNIPQPIGGFSFGSYYPWDAIFNYDNVTAYNSNKSILLQVNVIAFLQRYYDKTFYNSKTVGTMTIGQYNAANNLLPEPYNGTYFYDTAKQLDNNLTDNLLDNFGVVYFCCLILENINIKEDSTFLINVLTQAQLIYNKRQQDFANQNININLNSIGYPTGISNNEINNPSSLIYLPGCCNINITNIIANKIIFLNLGEFNDNDCMNWLSGIDNVIANTTPALEQLNVFNSFLTNIQQADKTSTNDNNMYYYLLKTDDSTTYYLRDRLFSLQLNNYNSPEIGSYGINWPQLANLIQDNQNALHLGFLGYTQNSRNSNPSLLLQTVTDERSFNIFSIFDLSVVDNLNINGVQITNIQNYVSHSIIALVTGVSSSVGNNCSVNNVIPYSTNNIINTTWNFGLDNSNQLFSLSNNVFSLNEYTSSVYNLYEKHFNYMNDLI